MQTENTYVETDLGNIALNPRGEYLDEVSYEYLDTVSYKGGSYVCLAELTKTISGIAPAQGKNTEHWQMLTLPGQLTPEAVAMHDDVVNKAKQVETSRTAAKESEDNVKAQESKVVQSVINEGTKQIKAVSDKAREQIGAVNTTGSTQVSIIETKGADQVEAIQEACENALQNISDGVDKGLSEEGKAADVKATGEAISKLTEDMSNQYRINAYDENVLLFYKSDIPQSYLTTELVNTNIKIYNFKAYSGDKLVKNLVPYREIDGTVCMLDKISGNYHYGIGSGVFIGN